MREIRLYFIAAPGRIKVGVTGDVQRRLSEIGKHLDHNIALLGHVSGSYGMEKHLHCLLAEHALGREWFTDCRQVREVMDRVLAGDELGFVPKERPIQANSTVELTPERWLARFNAFARMIFPEDTTSCVAAFLEITPEQARSYLLGDVELPDLLWKAFSAHVVQWVLAAHLCESGDRMKVRARR